MWCLIINLMAFGVGSVFVFALFKSHAFDQAINFIFRVRTNPILAITQVSRVSILILLNLLTLLSFVILLTSLTLLTLLT
tara:strand:- start:273 stop:512 length:240 start_codon:yes stop_codon:yes gene_type:complete